MLDNTKLKGLELLEQLFDRDSEYKRDIVNAVFLKKGFIDNEMDNSIIYQYLNALSQILRGDSSITSKIQGQTDISLSNIFDVAKQYPNYLIFLTTNRNFDESWKMMYFLYDDKRDIYKIYYCRNSGELEVKIVRYVEEFNEYLISLTDITDYFTNIYSNMVNTKEFSYDKYEKLIRDLLAIETPLSNETKERILANL